MNLRTLTEVMTRSQFWNTASRMFGGKRDMYRALGYLRELSVNDYRSRYKRNAVANRIVKALPKSTWRGGMDIVEDEDPTVETALEAKWHDLDKRLHIEGVCERVDTLAGIGRYGIIWIGAPGDVSTPLESCSADEIVYLTPYAEDDARIIEWDNDDTSPRYGRPMFYMVQRSRSPRQGIGAFNGAAKKVHWTRVLHIADGLLDDNYYGEPRLECVWNLLDDLEKVTGGGAEAFWKRADQGRHFDLDPNLKVPPAEKAKLNLQLEEYTHGLQRDLFTRGVTVKSLGSDTADFSRPVDSIISQISAGTGIPQRILMGSERGQLASNQDKSNWDDRVADRRLQFATPHVVRLMVDRFIELGALPAPLAGDYDVSFSAIRVMDDQQRSAVAKDWAGLNRDMQETVVTPNDIRERVLDLPPLGEVLSEQPGGGITPPGAPPTVPVPGAPLAVAKKGGAAYEHVHRAADRFRTARPSYRQRLLRRREAVAQQGEATPGADGQG